MHTVVDDTAAYFDPGYFEWQADRAAVSARAVVPLLMQLVGPVSVVDLGCGTGAWLQVFGEHGVEDVVGIDGSHIDQSQLRIPADRFVAADLAEPPELGRTFDLALTLEAVHYAPEEAASAIVAALASWAPVVYFSAAVPHQTGGPGLNRRWPSYWADLFAREGLRCYDLLRSRLWEHPEVDWWYAQNGLLFARDGALRNAEPVDPLPLVHPELLNHVAEQRPPDPPAPRGWLRRLRGTPDA